MTHIDWNSELLDQLRFGWQHQFRPRLDGLTDDEYFWEPVPGSWNVRPTGASPVGVGTSAYQIDFVHPEPQPAPVTTIAWRLAHVIVGVFGARNAAHFGGPPVDYDTYDYAGDARTALNTLDEGYQRWIDGVAALGADGLAEACGPAEGGYAAYPMATLVLHINREFIHHGAEISLLRDLYLRHRPVADPAAR